MSVSDQELLRHIRDEVNFILQNTAGKTKDGLEADAVLSRAVLRSLEIIGEASRKLSTSFKDNQPQIEWRKMAAT